MALINCNECNSVISDSAESCPKCGAAKPKAVTTQDKYRSNDTEIFSIIVDSYKGPMSIFGSTLGGAYGVFTHVVFASPGTESVLWAFAWIFIGLFIGGTIGLLFFGLPLISIHLFNKKGKARKIIGIILLTVFIGAVYLVYKIISNAT